MNLKVNAKLDPKFQPLAVVVREMKEATKENGQDVIVAIERNRGQISTYKTRIYPDGTGHDEENFRFIERIVKSLLWIAGGYKIFIAGSDVVGNKIKEAYTPDGIRAFDEDYINYEIENRQLENIALENVKNMLIEESIEPLFNPEFRISFIPPFTKNGIVLFPVYLGGIQTVKPFISGLSA